MSMSIEECTPYRCIMCGGLVHPMTDICMECGVDNYKLEREIAITHPEDIELTDYEVYGGD